MDQLKLTPAVNVPAIRERLRELRDEFARNAHPTDSAAHRLHEQHKAEQRAARLKRKSTLNRARDDADKSDAISVGWYRQM